MSAFRNVTQGFRSLWGQGGDEYDDVADETESPDSSKPHSASRRADMHNGPRAEAEEGDPFRPESSPQSRPTRGVEARRDERYPRYTAPAPRETPDYGGGSNVGARRLRPVSMPLRSREKNIYTLKPKSMDEASLAADYLKTGCAVVVNLEEVERIVAIRIIDFMSGVCYGLEHQGHAMKLGETIFLFTPGDFEISSDETDYAENRDFIFKDVATQPQAAQLPAAVATQSNAAERRSWER